MPIACGGVVLLGLRSRCSGSLPAGNGRYGKFSATEFGAENRGLAVLQVVSPGLIICL